MLDAFSERWKRDGDCDRLHMERFQPIIGGDGSDGEGGTIRFARSDVETEADGGKPILVAGEEAGLELPYGCRMGVCHTCIGKLCAGRLRDLRSGEVKTPQEGEMVRTCIHAPEGAVTIEL
jgi:ferredoxin